MINYDKKLIKDQDSFSNDEILMAQKNFYNQSSSKKKDYHFNTSSTIHTFGYRPMYHQDPITKHSFTKFSNSK